MDREPFVQWDVLNDEEPPYDFLTLLQKSQFKAELVRTFARRQHEHNLLVNELARLLEPSAEFTRLAIANIETRNLTATVVESWKPVVANAIGEWAKQRTLASVLTRSPSQDAMNPSPGPEGKPDRPERYDLRKKFWQALLARAKEKTSLHAHIVPSEFNWLGVRCGPGLNLNYVIKQEAAKVELYIDRGAGTAAENKQIFDRLEKSKEEIERAFGGQLSWNRLEGKQGCRIAHGMTLGGYKSDEGKWPEIHEAMIEAMIRLEKALASPLENLKTELAADGA
jgi:hypothetical protein